MTPKPEHVFAHRCRQTNAFVEQVLPSTVVVRTRNANAARAAELPPDDEGHDRFDRRSGALVRALVLGATLCGCPSPNGYGVPRTVPAGELAHVVAVEGGFLTRYAYGSTLDAWASPLVYQLRVGVHDRVDVGARAATNAIAGVDAKWNFVRTRELDLAASLGINVGAGAVHGSGLGFALYGHLPVLIGLNLSERVSVVLSPGLMSLWGPHDLFVQSAPGPRLFWRVGAGVDVRLSQSFALMPEVTLVRTFVPLGADTNASHLTFVVAGVAARAGRLPDYSR